MGTPSFQFYPGDWRKNAKLRRCSHAERGIWLEVLCLMHDTDEYGVLRWPLKDVATAAGCRVQDLRALLSKGVMKGADVGEEAEPFVFVPRHAGRDGQPVTLLARQEGPIWYSSRMVRDEYVRTKRGIGSRIGEEPKAAPIPPIGDGPSASPSSSPSVLPLSPSIRKSRKQEATHCPAGFEVSADMAGWAVDIGVPAENVKPQTEKFLDHHQAKGSRFSDWNAAWRTWMRNAVEFGQRRAAQ